MATMSGPSDASYDEEEDSFEQRSGDDDEYRMDDEEGDEQAGKRRRPNAQPAHAGGRGAPGGGAAQPATGYAQAAPRDPSKPLVPPPNPFQAATLKWAAYDILKNAGPDGMVIPDIVAALRAAGHGELMSTKTPEASIVAALAYDLQFSKTGAKRYALAFLHHDGRIPGLAERKPVMGRPPGRGRGRTGGEGWSGGRGFGGRRTGDDRTAAEAARLYGVDFVSTRRPRREAAQRAQAGIAALVSDELDGGEGGAGAAAAAQQQQQQQQQQQPMGNTALAALRRPAPHTQLQPFPPLAGGARQVLTGLAGPLTSPQDPIPTGVYVLRAGSGFVRQPLGQGGTSPAFNPAEVPPRHALCWFDAWNGRAFVRAGRTYGAAMLNGTPMPPFSEIQLLPGHSLSLSAVDYWRGEKLPPELLRAAGGLSAQNMMSSGGGGRQIVSHEYKPAPGGWGNFYQSDAALAATGGDLGCMASPTAGGAPQRGYYVSPAALAAPLTTLQMAMASGADDHVLALLSAPVPPGFTARSWREDKRDIDGQRRQFLYMLVDSKHGGEDGGAPAEVLAIVGVETTRYHPKFTITPAGLSFAKTMPPSMHTKRRIDVTNFLANCIGSVCVEGRPGGLPLPIAGLGPGDAGGGGGAAGDADSSDQDYD